ncbi:MAG TPA: prephenate dehydrogenase [Longimicrobium sp.]
MRTVAVVGLGLIGGSAARALAAAGVRVVGWDRDASAVDAALGEGVLAAALGADFAGVEAADALLLAVPVLRAREVLAAARPRLDGVRLVTDAGSTKRSVAAAAWELGLAAKFVGAHPLAGDHRSGWAASRADLFAGARVYLCPTRETSDEALVLARELWERAGGRTEVMDAAEHDRRLAWTSHLPQAASTALAVALDARGVARAELGPGGRDVTRLAASSPEMWTDVARDNADELAAALRAMEDALRGLREAIKAGDEGRIREIFARGREWGE